MNYWARQAHASKRLRRSSHSHRPLIPKHGNPKCQTRTKEDSNKNPVSRPARENLGFRGPELQPYSILCKIQNNSRASNGRPLRITPGEHSRSRLEAVFSSSESCPRFSAYIPCLHIVQI